MAMKTKSEVMDEKVTDEMWEAINASLPNIGVPGELPLITQYPDKGGSLAPFAYPNDYIKYYNNRAFYEYGEFGHFYRPISPYTVVSPDRCYTLYALASQALNLAEDFWECGVYRGGTAMMLATLIAERGWAQTVKLHLFDTFEGMPQTDAEKDHHQAGDFWSTSVESVSRRVGHPGRVVLHQGLMPETFGGMEGAKIAFAHIDVDVYKSVRDCCEFIYPRVVPGGVMIFDDYGFKSCPGARQAVDEFFKGKAEKPLVLPTAQAIIFKQEVGLRAASRNLLYNLGRVMKRGPLGKFIGS